MYIKCAAKASKPASEINFENFYSRAEVLKMIGKTGPQLYKMRKQFPKPIYVTIKITPQNRPTKAFFEKEEINNWMEQNV